MAIIWDEDIDETKITTKEQIIGVIAILVIVIITFWVIMKMKKRK